MLLFNKEEFKQIYHTYIISEIGINHNGSVEIAKQLIDISKKVGADCVKFQKRVVRESFTEDKLNEPYLTKNSWGKTYGEHKDYLEFSDEQFREIREYARNRNIDFACTGCDKESVDFLSTLDMDFYKCASGDLTNLPLLRHIASKGKPYIISTGMSSMDTIKKVVSELNKINPNFAILSCVSSYPTPVSEININNVTSFIQEFPDKVIGYSGHENGFIPTIGAISKGARIVERHITLDKNMRGSDHSGSLNPQEFEEMVKSITTLELSLGNGKKFVYPSEKPFISKLTKSICTKSDIKKGDVITEDNVTTKHPGGGISPLEYDSIIGAIVKRDLLKDTILRYDDIVLDQSI